MDGLLKSNALVLIALESEELHGSELPAQISSRDFHNGDVLGELGN